MPLPIEQPEWPEILRAAITRKLAKLHTSLPGIIVTYNGATQTATVQPMIQEEDGEEFQSLPIIPDVRIDWPAGGGYAMTLPLVPGDSVRLIFSELDPSHWRSTGQNGPPPALARHGLYASAYPCAGPDAKTLPAATGKLLISSLAGAGASITIDGTAVHIGDSVASDFVALSTKVDTALTSILTYLTTHTHTVPISGPAGTTPSTPPVAPTPPVLVTTAATKAKAV